MARKVKAYESEFNAALDLWHGGDAEGAIGALQALAIRHPDEPAIHGMLGGYLQEQGGLVEAVPHTQRAVELSPTSELAARTHFHVLFELGRLEEAVAELRRFHCTTESEEYRREWSHLISEVESLLSD